MPIQSLDHREESILSPGTGCVCGPWVSGLVIDLFRPAYGDESIRYALACMVFVNLWCATHYYCAARTLKADLASASD
jgi:hypothetical protein